MKSGLLFVISVAALFALGAYFVGFRDNLALAWGPFAFLVGYAFAKWY